jgi:NTP pyrophosphatase (non-canonical NTP hydrolase)
MKSVEELRKSNESKLSLEPINSHEPRACVQWFAEMMELKLQDNDTKDGWKNCSPEDLLDRVGDEFEELTNALLVDANPRDIIKECADVANFCMMIADIMKGRVK